MPSISRATTRAVALAAVFGSPLTVSARLHRSASLTSKEEPEASHAAAWRTVVNGKGVAPEDAKNRTVHLVIDGGNVTRRGIDLFKDHPAYKELSAEKLRCQRALPASKNDPACTSARRDFFRVQNCLRARNLVASLDSLAALEKREKGEVYESAHFGGASQDCAKQRAQTHVVSEMFLHGDVQSMVRGSLEDIVASEAAKREFLDSQIGRQFPTCIADFEELLKRVPAFGCFPFYRGSHGARQAAWCHRSQGTWTGGRGRVFAPADCQSCAVHADGNRYVETDKVQMQVFDKEGKKTAGVSLIALAEQKNDSASYQAFAAAKALHYSRSNALVMDRQNGALSVQEREKEYDVVDCGALTRAFEVKQRLDRDSFISDRVGLLSMDRFGDYLTREDKYPALYAANLKRITFKIAEDINLHSEVKVNLHFGGAGVRVCKTRLNRHLFKTPDQPRKEFLKPAHASFGCLEGAGRGASPPGGCPGGPEAACGLRVLRHQYVRGRSFHREEVAWENEAGGSEDTARFATVAEETVTGPGGRYAAGGAPASAAEAPLMRFRDGSGVVRFKLGEKILSDEELRAYENKLIAEAIQRSYKDVKSPRASSSAAGGGCARSGPAWARETPSEAWAGSSDSDGESAAFSETASEYSSFSWASKVSRAGDGGSAASSASSAQAATPTSRRTGLLAGGGRSGAAETPLARLNSRAAGLLHGGPPSTRRQWSDESARSSRSSRSSRSDFSSNSCRSGASDFSDWSSPSSGRGPPSRNSSASSRTWLGTSSSGDDDGESVSRLSVGSSSRGSSSRSSSRLSSASSSTHASASPGPSPPSTPERCEEAAPLARPQQVSGAEAAPGRVPLSAEEFCSQAAAAFGSTEPPQAPRCVPDCWEESDGAESGAAEGSIALTWGDSSSEAEKEEEELPIPAASRLARWLSSASEGEQERARGVDEKRVVRDDGEENVGAEGGAKKKTAESSEGSTGDAPEKAQKCNSESHAAPATASATGASKPAGARAEKRRRQKANRRARLAAANGSNAGAASEGEEPVGGTTAPASAQPAGGPPAEDQAARPTDTIAEEQKSASPEAEDEWETVGAKKDAHKQRAAQRTEDHSFSQYDVCPPPPRERGHFHCHKQEPEWKEFRAGNWYCEHCNFHNFSLNKHLLDRGIQKLATHCYRCEKPRYTPEEWRAWKAEQRRAKAAEEAKAGASGGVAEGGRGVYW